MAGPADEGWNAERTYPVRVFLAAIRRRARIGPRVVVRTVVRRILHDGVFGETEIVDELEQLAHVHVVFDHAVTVLVLARKSDVFRSEEHTSELQSQSNLVCRLLL